MPRRSREFKTPRVDDPNRVCVCTFCNTSFDADTDAEGPTHTHLDTHDHKQYIMCGLCLMSTANDFLLIGMQPAAEQQAAANVARDVRNSATPN